MQKPYKLPEIYLAWKKFQEHCELFRQVTPCPINVLGEPDVLHNLSFLYNQWSQGYPVYCVRQSLLDDMQATDVGENLELFADIKLSIPAYVLFFPQGKIKSPNGFINYLVIYHQELNLPEHKYLVAWGGMDSNGSTILGYKRIRHDGTLQRSALVGGIDRNNSASTIRNLVLQSILLLQYYPDISNQMEALPSKAKGFGKPLQQESAYQLPRWLGYEKKPIENTGKSRTASGKATHFRRGHWRSQPCGEGRKEIQITWVRPAWVNRFTWRSH